MDNVSYYITVANECEGRVINLCSKLRAFALRGRQVLVNINFVNEST